MSKTGGGRGSNQYGPRGTPKGHRDRGNGRSPAGAGRADLKAQAAPVPQVHESGSHRIGDGELHVCGRARGEATGDATILGWGDAEVVVADHATAVVGERVQARGSGQSTLFIGGHAHGIAVDEATMSVDGASGEGSGRAQVSGTGRARIRLRENASGVIDDHVEADVADDVELVALGRSRVRAGGRAVVWAEPAVEVELREDARRELLPAVA